MSGIGGIFYRNKRSVNPYQLKSMASSLSHRGIDGISFYTLSNVGLFHCMLHSTPESLLETLPSTNSNNNLIMTWHGRIDNREDLRNKTSWDKPLSKTTDSDLILAAYERWGSACTNHLLGDFSFAIWDKSRQQMFCARDHMGIKPFYYLLTDTLFAFASEIKALLKLPECVTQPNDDRIADYLTCIAAENHSTFYEKIFRLPPGNFLKVSNVKKKRYSFWKPQPSFTEFKDNKDYEEHFYNIFSDAVNHRLRSAFPIGSLLSGGLDSSSIVCMAASSKTDTFPSPIQTFSGVFDEITCCDERLYFQSVLDKYSLPHHFIHTDKINPGHAYDQVSKIEDEPFHAPHFFMLQTIMSLAQKNNVRILLDGYDGDSAVSLGAGLFTELLIQCKWLRLFKECKNMESSPSFRNSIKFLLGLCRDTFIYSLSPIQPTAFRVCPLHNKITNLNESFARRVHVKERLAVVDSNLPKSGQKEFTRHRMTISQPLHPLLLEFLERQNAHHNLIGRYPFFDKKIIEFCLALPADLKRKNGYNRYIVRKSLSSILPKQIRLRKEKTDFSNSMKHAFFYHGKHWLKFNIDRISEQAYNYIDRKNITRLYKQISDEPTSINLRDVSYLLRVISLDRWLKNKRGDSNEQA